MEPVKQRSTPILSDEETVDRILSGETYLYENIMRKFNTRLYRISMSIINDDMEAEDIMQTAYINAFRQLSAFRKESSFSTWLTRILINESLLHKKRNAKTLEVLSKQVTNEYDFNTPIKSLMNKELKELLEKAVSNLPEKYRLVFVMREIQEMSTNETMDALELGESNVKIRLARAKEMLRNELSSYYKSTQLFEFDLVRCDKIVDYVMARIKEAN